VKALDKQKALGIMFLLLLGLWMTLVPQMDFVQLIVGMLATLIVIFYSFNLFFNKKETSFATVLGIFTMLWLFVVLLKEIVVANLDIARVVLSPSLPIDPSFQSYKQPLNSPLLQTFYGNAITLTPGTLCVGLDEDEILIHTLTPRAADGVGTSSVRRLFIDLEGSGRP